MSGSSVQLVSFLLLSSGLLLGGVVGFFIAWRARSRLLSKHDLARTELAQATVRNEQVQADLDQVRQLAAGLQAHNDDLNRRVIQAESQANSLQERLNEMRQSLQAGEQQLAERQERLLNLEKDLAGLTASHAEKMQAHEQLQQAFEQSGKQLKSEFENLANLVLEEKGKIFATNSQASLNALLQPFREQIQGFQQRVNQVHDEAVKGNATLASEIKQILDVGLKMSAEAGNLAAALKGNKKLTGGWGEVQLEQALQLAGLVKEDHYEAQVRFADNEGGYRQPDFVLKLPDNKHIVLDSKVSLVDYDRAISAETEALRQAALDEHVKAVRNHIDDLAKKDYSNLIGIRSPSFVLMFMPIEAAYIEALKHKRDLFDQAYRQNVILVSHTTLMPILKTVANLWMVARSNEEAHQLSERAGDIYNQVVVVADHLKRLGDSLGTVGNHYNKTVTSLAGRQGLYGKVQRFNELSTRANKTMPALEPMNKDFETEKLELIEVSPDASGDDSSD